MTLSDNKYKGFLLALLAAMMWGISGACVQYLIQHKGIDTGWLVSVRLLIAGTLLLAYAQSRKEISIWQIWKSRKDAVSIILFGILGMLAVQYTYFAAIFYSNAATATVLQYMGPAIIVCYLAFKEKKLPTIIEVAAVLLTLSGTLLIVTHGSMKSLSISGLALFWGILSAFTLASYSLLPLRLLINWDSSVIVGWGMLIGGVFCSFIHAPWKVSGQWDIVTFSIVAFIILFASLIAFYIFMISVKIIGPAYASLLSCTEPLSSTLLAVIWLHVPYGISDWIGTAFILLTIILLALSSRKKETPEAPSL